MKTGLMQSCYVSSDGILGGGVGGSLPEGLYISDVNGNLTYFGSGTAYEGVTFESSYDVYWFEVDADGNQTTPVLQGGNALALGENLPIIVLGTGTYPSINLVMYRFDSVAMNGAGDFSYNLSDLTSASKNSGTISGGAWNETLPLDIVREDIVSSYVGGLTPPEGDYDLLYRITDPNGTTTDSVAVTKKWAPYVMINGYKVTGSEYILDVEPPVDIAGYDSIDLQYVLGADIATDGSGNPIYGAGGEIGYTDGTLVEELAVSFVKGDNSFIIANIADDYGNTTSTYPFEATRIPALRYDGLTTVDEETYGTTYDGALSLIVDEGLAEETTATPEEAPYTFTSGDYRAYNFTASYTYPATTASNSVAVVITYNEFSFTQFTDLDQIVLQNVDVFPSADFTDYSQIVLQNTGEQYNGTQKEDVFFHADGQSNMAGRQPAYYVPMPPNIRVWSWDIEEWIPLDTEHPEEWKREDDLEYGENPALYFMKQYATANPDKVVRVLLSAKGGAPIASWANESGLYGSAVSEINKALPKTNTTFVSAMLWIQGEADTNEVLADYRNARDAVFANYRAEPYAISAQMPILTSELMQGAAGGMNPVIREWDTDGIAYNIYVDVDPLENLDGVHFNTTANQQVGNAWYTKYEAL